MGSGLGSGSSRDRPPGVTDFKLRTYRLSYETEVCHTRQHDTCDASTSRSHAGITADSICGVVSYHVLESRVFYISLCNHVCDIDGCSRRMGGVLWAPSRGPQ